MRIQRNPTKSQIAEVIREYKTKQFNPDDQLFIFFAGHGTYQEETNEGFLVCRDSPAKVLEENQSQFFNLDRLVKLINDIPSQHVFLVFDVCYSGKVWYPSVQMNRQISLAPTRPAWSYPVQPTRLSSLGYSFLNGGLRREQKGEVSREEFIRQKMKNRTRTVWTLGAKPVLDDDPKERGHSPFANRFLKALKTSGGDDGVLTTDEIFIELARLDPEPHRGWLSGSEGGFLFIVPDSLRTPSQQK